MNELIIEHSESSNSMIIDDEIKKEIDNMFRSLKEIFDEFKAKNYVGIEEPVTGVICLLFQLGYNILHFAIARKNTEVIRLIFELPHEVLQILVKGEDCSKRTPLHFVAAFGLIKAKGAPDFNIIKRIIDEGANPNAITIVNRIQYNREMKHP